MFLQIYFFVFFPLLQVLGVGVVVVVVCLQVATKQAFNVGLWLLEKLAGGEKV